ncbi:MAG TPA: 50S ribosomal protein L29 [Candidatus Poseidoniales archaeon]|jgi:ribosomal protein L29|nr:MAG: 50S ribosomal protein L29 [Euryarchaeota archaeon]HIG38261.1 50S ribosomal protein L29 [Candidatus Poseidoniales archaeon]HIL44532.1 50S ribosomal protein L29 [Candidatus Poseidoniales archaeon]
MSHIRSRDIETMSPEKREEMLEELREELLQLRAQQALGGSVSNSGAYKQTRRSIARMLTRIKQKQE